MNLLPAILSILVAQTTFGQTMPLTFTPVKNTMLGQTMSIAHLPNNKISEITVKADSTFEFWSRPHISCFTWKEYKGTWKRDKDTLFFYDKYEVVESDVRATYKKDTQQSFRISFRTDKNAQLTNGDIKIQYVYDFDSNLQDVERGFTLKPGNRLELPFKNIPHLDQLASIKIEYQPSRREKRYAHLTQNKTVNRRKGDLPNNIDVEFVEKPQRETVYRIIKGIMQNSTLTIISSAKTRSTIPDYHDDIEFENSYGLTK